jgi:ubiquinone/menaquinone biosynthesis C-methylase UbiE
MDGSQLLPNPASDRCTDRGTDHWSLCLNRHRNGSNATQATCIERKVSEYTARLLRHACPQPGQTIVDIGTGTGNVAWAAIKQTGPDLQVILTDISAPLLNQASRIAAASHYLPQCSFIQCAAARLALADHTADLVTSRAALAYEPDKQTAFHEIFRILKPGGRLAIAEPIFQDDALAATALTIVLAARPADHPDKLLPLLQRWKSAQFPVSQSAINAMAHTNFTERDLLRFAAKAGFSEIHLQLHIDTAVTSPPLPWEVFTATAPHPLAPSLAEILEQSFTADERATFESALRPIIETGAIAQTDRIAYLTAIKPAA